MPRPSPHRCPPFPQLVLGAMIAAVLTLTPLSSPARADIDPASGIDFVRIGAVGNAAYVAPFPDMEVNGRGRVDYEYAIGKYEVTTREWVEFFNAAYALPADQRVPFLQTPGHWGAAPGTVAGQAFSVPAGREMWAVGNISWRMAAIYCNWLCNNKGTTRAAFMSGAYDVATFGYTGNIFTDQLAHTPGARYHLPTWDEWLKAAHFDPAKANPDGSTGGWWRYPNGSDTRPIYDPPPSMGGTGQANAGFSGPVNPFTIPLGAYDVTSPWGLYDVAGGTTEWMETAFFSQGLPVDRLTEGSYWTSMPGGTGGDHVAVFGSDFPSITTFDYGFRIASSVPAPATVLVVGFGGLFLARRGRGASHESQRWNQDGVGARAGRRELVSGPNHQG